MNTKNIAIMLVEVGIVVERVQELHNGLVAELVLLLWTKERPY